MYNVRIKIIREKWSMLIRYRDGISFRQIGCTILNLSSALAENMYRQCLLL